MLRRRFKVEEAGRVDVDEVRNAAGAEDGEGGREGAERVVKTAAPAGRPSVLRPISIAVQATRAAHREVPAGRDRECALEALDLGAENVPPALANPADRGDRLGADRSPLAAERIRFDQLGSHGASDDGREGYQGGRGIGQLERAGR